MLTVYIVCKHFLEILSFNQRQKLHWPSFSSIGRLELCTPFGVKTEEKVKEKIWCIAFEPHFIQEREKFKYRSCSN